MHVGFEMWNVNSERASVLSSLINWTGHTIISLSTYLFQQNLGTHSTIARTILSKSNHKF